MGVFNGFFKYDKPGPGIKKDGPKKKSFFVFFETWGRNFWKFIPVSAIYLLFCLPILTVGLAEAGIANVTRNIARDKHSFGVSDFLSTIKKNWKQALPAGIINTLITALIVFAGWFYFTSEGTFSLVALSFMIVLFILFSFMKYYVWLIIITFNLPLKKIYKNSFLFVFANLKNNLLIGIVSLLIPAMLVGINLVLPYNIVIVLTAFLFICVYPGFIKLLTQFCIFPSVKKLMIDPYYEEHPDDDVELRRNLGLEVLEEEEESVFEDNRILGEDK